MTIDSDHVTCVEIEASLRAQLEASRTHVSLLRSELAKAADDLDACRKRADVMSQLLAPAALELAILAAHVDTLCNYDTQDAKKIAERIGRLSKGPL